MIKEIIKTLAGIGLIVVMIWILITLGISLHEDYKEYKTYENFCQNKSICFCEYYECDFRTTSINGELTNESKELCNLARKLNDEKTLFRIGC
jgi:hypothetical protein